MNGLTLLSTHQRGGGNFDKVNNPGGWSSFSYCPVFDSESQGGKHGAHFLLDCCQPVPPNEDDSAIGIHGAWKFSTRGGRRGKTRIV